MHISLCLAQGVMPYSSPLRAISILRRLRKGAAGMEKAGWGRVAAKDRARRVKVAAAAVQRHLAPAAKAIRAPNTRRHRRTKPPNPSRASFLQRLKQLGKWSEKPAKLYRGRWKVLGMLLVVWCGANRDYGSEPRSAIGILLAEGVAVSGQPAAV